MGRGGDRRRADHRPVAGDRSGELRGQGPGRLQLRRSQQPRLQLVARGPRGEPGQRGRDAPHARRHRPRTGVGLAGACAPQRPLQAPPGPLRPVRARRGAALRRARSIAGSSGTSPISRCGCSRRTRARAALHALRPAPVPPPRPRGLPGDQDRRPDLDGPLRRAGPQRRELDQAERQDAPAGLHPLDGLRQGHAQARSQRAVRGLQAAHRRRPGLPPARHQARAQRAAVGARQRLDRRRPAARAHRSTPRSARAASRRPAAASSPCTSPSGATRRGRPTVRAGSRWPSSRAICSRAPTSPTAIPGSGC